MEKVLVAMSGGVDSSVAAVLLLKQGYEVTGAYMINYDSGEGTDSLGESCWVPDYRDATRVAAKLGIQLLKLDFRKDYKEKVLDYMFTEYAEGRTPNPDVWCNKYIKFGAWLKKARELGFTKLATGHYARVEDNKLFQAKDKDKDQTYFLHQLNQKQLSQVIFPLGEYTKSEVRVLAKKYDLPTAEKEESMGICFVGEVPMKDFLQQKIKIKKGKVILSNGEIVGEHDGLAFYTIGQRGGLNCHPDLKRSKGGVSLKHNIRDSSLVIQNDNAKPLFVIDKNIKKNQLIVGYENNPLLHKKEITVVDVNWIRQKPVFPLKCEVRLRHRQPLQKAVVVSSLRRRSTPTVRQREVFIKFVQPQRAPTPGQFAVLYKDEICLGGGIIID